MKRFLTKTAITFAALFLTSLALDYLITTGLRKVHHSHLTTMNAIMNDSINAEVLFYGESRMSAGVNPVVFDSISNGSSYNLAISGQHFLPIYFRHLVYLKHQRKPKMIVLNIDEIIFSSPYNSGFEKEQYLPYVQEESFRQLLKEGYHFTWLDFHIPLWRYKGSYKYIFRALLEEFGIMHSVSPIHKGFYAHEAAMMHQENLNQMLQNKPQKIKFDSITLTYLNQFLNECKQDSIQVILINTPVYYELQRAYINWEETFINIDSLINNKNIPYLNYSDSTSTFNRQAAYFHDTGHLNKTGAELFTTQLAHDLDSLNIYP